MGYERFLGSQKGTLKKKDRPINQLFPQKMSLKKKDKPILPRFPEPNPFFPPATGAAGDLPRPGARGRGREVGGGAGAAPRRLRGVDATHAAVHPEDQGARDVETVCLFLFRVPGFFSISLK